MKSSTCFCRLVSGIGFPTLLWANKKRKSRGKYSDLALANELLCDHWSKTSAAGGGSHEVAGQCSISSGRYQRPERRRVAKAVAAALRRGEHLPLSPAGRRCALAFREGMGSAGDDWRVFEIVQAKNGVRWPRALARLR